MYHSICNDTYADGNFYFNTITHTNIFRKQMEYLKNNKYKVIDMDTAERIMSKNKKPGKEKYVVITFDDGLKNVMINAFPIMKEMGFTATVYVITDYISDHPLLYKGRETMTWNDLKLLLKEKFIVGCHSASHQKLQSMNNQQLETEIGKAKERLELYLNNKVHHFAFPYAFPENDTHYRERVYHILKKYHYTTSVTTRLGRWDIRNGSHFIKRLPINSDDDLALFQAKLNGAYDWLYPFQYLYKVIKGLRK